MIKKVFRQIFPKVDPEVQASVDKKSLDNIWRICLVMFCFEAVALVLFVASRKVFDHDAWVSIKSASFCLVACLFGAIGAGLAARKEKPSHAFVASFNAFYYLVLSLWTLDVSLRNYRKGEQILTFFAVQILMVCFVTIRPIYGIVYPILICSILYASFYRVDHAQGLNIFNFALLEVVIIVGMVVRFYSERISSESAVQLEKTNEQLFYNNRHDGLTGLRNRKALEEDVQKIVKDHVCAYMMDVNYFKEINDTYGHAVGDMVLKETASWIRSIFSVDRCYRYGGDEFLILSAGVGPYTEDTATITIPEVPGQKILLSIGRADGDPRDHDELYKLISQADEKLYEVKERTHVGK